MFSYFLFYVNHVSVSAFTNSNLQWQSVLFMQKLLGRYAKQL
jgi:hypothetical protein